MSVLKGTSGGWNHSVVVVEGLLGPSAPSWCSRGYLLIFGGSLHGSPVYVLAVLVE